MKKETENLTLLLPPDSYWITLILFNWIQAQLNPITFHNCTQLLLDVSLSLFSLVFSFASWRVCGRERCSRAPAKRNFGKRPVVSTLKVIATLALPFHLLSHSFSVSVSEYFLLLCVCVCVCACWLTLSSPLPLCITGKTRKLEGSCTGKEQFCEQLSETVKCLCAGFNHRSRHFPSPVTWIVSIGAWICSLILFFRTQLTLNAAASCPSLSWCCSSFNFELDKSIHLTCNTFLLSHESKGWTVKRK